MPLKSPPKYAIRSSRFCVLLRLDDVATASLRLALCHPGETLQTQGLPSRFRRRKIGIIMVQLSTTSDAVSVSNFSNLRQITGIGKACRQGPESGIFPRS